MNNKNILSLIDFVSEYKKACIKKEDESDLSQYSFHCYQKDLELKSKDKNFLIIDESNDESFIRIKRVIAPSPPIIAQEILNKVDSTDKNNLVKLNELDVKLYKEYIKETEEYNKLIVKLQTQIAFYNKIYSIISEINLENKQAYLGICQVIGTLKEKKINHPLFSFKISIIVESKGDIVFKLAEDIANLNTNILSNADESFNYHYSKIKTLIKDSPIPIHPFENLSYQSIIEEIISYIHSGSTIKTTMEGYNTEDFIKSKQIEAPIILTNWSIYLTEKKDHYYFEDLEISKKHFTELEANGNNELLNIFNTTTPKKICNRIGFQHNETLALKYNFEETLFFPLAYNEEQEKIVKNLLEYDKCIVQGPPGTGKTHAITNVMTHFLANENNVLFTSYKSDAINALEEKLPDYIKKYSLILKDFSSSEDIKKQTEKFVKNVQLIISTYDQNSSIFKNEYIELQKTYNKINEDYSETNYKIKKLLEFNQKKIILDKIEYSFSDAFEYINKSKVNKFNLSFNSNEFESVKQIKWKDFMMATKNISLNKIRYNDITEKILTHNFLELPDLLLSEYKNNIECLKMNKLDVVNSFNNLDQELNIKSLRDYSEAFKSTCKKYSMVLNQDTKQNFIMFYKNRFNLKGLAESFEFFNENINKIIEALKINISIPNQEYLETLYKEDFEHLLNGGDFSGILNSLVKRKQKIYFSQITISGQPVKDTNGWKKIKEILILNKKINFCMGKWNSLCLSAGLSIIKKEDFQNGFLANKKDLEMFTEIANEYENLSLFIKVYRELKDNPFDNFEMIDKYLFLLDRRSDILKSLESNRQQLNKLTSRFYFNDDFRGFYYNISKDNIPEIEIYLKKKINEESVYKEVLKSYQYIYVLIDELKNIKSKSILNLINLIVENSYDLEVSPEELPESIKIKILTDFIKSNETSALIDDLMQEKIQINKKISLLHGCIIENRIKFFIAKSFSDEKSLSILSSIQTLIGKIGKGTGKKAITYNMQIASLLSLIREKIPCMIMPHEHVSKYFQGKVGVFDLLIIDEASQSEAAYINILLKGKKILVVGDNKQVSPEGIFSNETFMKIKNKHLMELPISLSSIITEDASIYDLASNLLVKQKVLMKEHFRCHPAIIEFSNKQYYEGEINCIKKSKNTELKPLIDVKIENGKMNKNNDINRHEALFILEEIKKLISNFNFSKEIAVISLKGPKQAKYIKEQLLNEFGATIFDKFNIVVGTPKEMQGKERDIVFLSMVVCPEHNSATNKIQDAQRYNVACSRAKETMYLVRSVDIKDLSLKDENRTALISHFQNPYPNQTEEIKELRELCESPFELEIFDYLVGKNYNVQPQVKQGQFRIDMVVHDGNNSLAIECDGDRYHNEFNWLDDLHRQTVLERAGWIFWRTLYSQYKLDTKYVLTRLITKLENMKILPGRKNTIKSDEFVTHRKEIIRLNVEEQI